MFSRLSCRKRICIAISKCMTELLSAALLSLSRTASVLSIAELCALQCAPPSSARSLRSLVSAVPAVFSLSRIVVSVLQ